MPIPDPPSQFSIWLPPVLAAFSAAGLTAWFSLLRFRRERWWEKKFEAYVAIMEALHDIVAGFDEELEPGDISAERKVELREQYRSGRNAVYKQIDIGRFLLNDDTVSALQKMLRELDNAEGGTDFSEYLSSSSHAVHTCIERIRAIGKRDLRSGRLGF
jgi:hypothetical protein